MSSYLVQLVCAKDSGGRCGEESVYDLPKKGGGELLTIERMVGIYLA